MADKVLITSKKSLLYGNTSSVARQAQTTSNQRAGVERLNDLIYTGNPVDYSQSQSSRTINNRLRTLWKNR